MRLQGSRCTASTGRGLELEPIVIKGTLATPRGLIPGSHIVVESGRIREVASGEPRVQGTVYDFGESIVAPGFIDIHVHGGGGHGVMDASLGAINGLSARLAAGGVTSFLATTHTASSDRTAASIRAVMRAMEGGTPGARPLGVHLEGPYINPRRIGAQPVENIRAPNIPELEEVHGLMGDRLRVVSLAPEMEGALDAVRWLTGKGVVASAGHSDASYEEMGAGVKAGVRHVAHLFNGMRPFHHREPGIVGWALVDDRVSVELIADGVHVHPASLRLAARMKGAEKTVLVSDSIKPAGLPDGDYDYGGRRVTVSGGRCLLEDGVLAGSVIRLNDAVRNMVELAGFTVGEAIKMASSSPSRVLGMEGRKGSLARGMDADVTVLDEGFNVLFTMVEGRVVYEGRRSPDAS